MFKNKIVFTLSIMLIFSITIFAESTQKQKATRFDNMQIRSKHPRIWIDQNKIVWLKEKCKGKSTAEISNLAGPSSIGKALTFVITGDEKIGREAITMALGKTVELGSKFADLMSADGKHIRNSFQHTLVHQAICYDWCYPLLTSEEKKTFQSILIPGARRYIDNKRLWRSFHNTLHNSAWPVMAISLALYGDTPFAQEAINFLKPELEDAMKTFDLLFPDGEWPEGVDYNRHSTYQELKIYLALKSSTGIDFIKDSPHFRNTIAYILYSVKPNGLLLPNDDNDWPYLGFMERHALLMLASEYRDGYCQYFLNHCPIERFKAEPRDLYADLLWYDPSIPEKPISALPLSRIFRTKGLIITRSNWGWDREKERAPDTWLTFHCGDYFGDHAQYDINAFQIYHKGELALDSGRYDDDWDYYDRPEKIRQSQFFNYYQRTIAHNTMLVLDPTEKFHPNLLNDGGQLRLIHTNKARNVPEDYEQGTFPSDDGLGTCDWVTNPGRWETGDITSYKTNNEFMYVRGDGTKAYSAAKLKSFVRHLFFLQPNLIVVFDRVVSTKPEFKKTWLLHSINEPQIAKNGKAMEFTYGEGRLVCNSILPKEISVNKIGGTGNEFLVDGVQLKCGLQSLLHPADLHYGEIPGAWRIEESPIKAATEDYFLNVILVTDKNSKETPTTKVISDDASQICLSVSSQKSKSATLTFTKGEKSEAQIKITDKEKIIIEEKMPDLIQLEKNRY